MFSFCGRYLKKPENQGLRLEDDVRTVRDEETDHSGREAELLSGELYCCANSAQNTETKD